jgi:cobalamin biosynthesis protein CobT
MDPAENDVYNLKDVFRSIGAQANKTALIADESDSNEKPANETAEVKRPTTTCTYQVNYKMNTYYLFGDNWNVTKDTLKKSCEKGRSRVLNHWSYREWQDQNGTHFCAKVSSVPVRSSERTEADGNLFLQFSSTCLSLPRKPWRTGLTRSSLRMIGALRSTARTTRRMALFLAMPNARQGI